MTKNDPALDEIRRVRHSISKEFDHDPHRMTQHYINLQEKYADRMFKPPAVGETIREDETEYPGPKRS